MSASSGYPSSKKSVSSIAGYTETETKSQFNTLQPSGSDHVSLDITQRAAYEVANGKIVGTAQKRVVTCVGLNAKKDDIIRFTSGVLSGMDFSVLKAPDANTAIIAGEFDTAPSASDTFDLYRYTFVKVNASGEQIVTVTQTPIQAVVDGVDTEIELDTTNPNNTIPLPTYDRLVNAELIDGDIYAGSVDATTGQTLCTPTVGKKKIRLVQNAGAELYIFKGTTKIGALEKGGKFEFCQTFNGTDAVIIKSTSGTVTTNISWNILG